MSQLDFSVLVGKTIVKITGGTGDGEMIFRCSDGTRYMLTHYQNCCEQVWIEDIVGDLSDLLSGPILLAEEVSNYDDPPPDGEYAESYTWTFYKLATNRGAITIRWYGQSNGYYSEEVSFVQMGDWILQETD